MNGTLIRGRVRSKMNIIRATEACSLLHSEASILSCWRGIVSREFLQCTQCIDCIVAALRIYQQDGAILWSLGWKESASSCVLDLRMHVKLRQKWPACVASDHPELFVAALALQYTAGAPALSSSCTSSPRPASLVLSVVKIVLLPHKNQKKQGGVDKALLKAKFHSSTLRFGPYGRAPGSTP